MKYNICKTDYGNYLSTLSNKELTSEYNKWNKYLSNYYQEKRTIKGKLMRIYGWLSIFIFLGVLSDIFNRGLHNPMEVILFLVSIVGIALFVIDEKHRTEYRKK